ncbi:MAG: hypothetical protein J0L92_29675 [Deltaproteobacteria bacterium]|nr:hypothetical protein [Deltaproteobacteria bacterium]
MRSLVALVIVMAASFVALVPTAVALAQATDPAAEGVPPEVLALLRRGVEARVRGEEEAALDAFAQAHAAAPSLGRASAQLGLAHQALEHWLEAEVLLRAALESDDPWIGRNRDAITGSLATLDAHLATIDVTAAEGTEIELDDDARFSPTPLSLRVLPGPHRLHARRAGHVDRIVEIETTAAHTHAIEITLSPLAPVAPEAQELSREPPPDAVPSARVATPRGSTEPHALVWVGLATSLVGLGAAIITHLLAEDATRGRTALQTMECPGPSEPCDRLHARLASELVPYEIAVNVLFGVTALGGVLTAAGLGLTLTSSDDPEAPSGPTVRLTPSGLTGQFW